MNTAREEARRLFLGEDYAEAVELSKMRQYMRYGPKQFRQDWEVAVALAAIMGVEGQCEHFTRMLESCFKRILAYSANNPDGRPWEADDDHPIGP